MLKLVSVYKSKNAEDVLYELLKERSVPGSSNINISHTRLPLFADHVKFIKRKPYRFWYLITIGNLPIGACYLTKRNEVGIQLFEAQQGKGYALEALNLLTTTHKPLKAIPAVRPGRFIANINPKNEASIRLFKTCGFTEKQVTYEL